MILSLLVSCRPEAGVQAVCRLLPMCWRARLSQRSGRRYFAQVLSGEFCPSDFCTRMATSPELMITSPLFPAGRGARGNNETPASITELRGTPVSPPGSPTIAADAKRPSESANAFKRSIERISAFTWALGETQGFSRKPVKALMRSHVPLRELALSLGHWGKPSEFRQNQSGVLVSPRTLCFVGPVMATMATQMPRELAPPTWQSVTGSRCRSGRGRQSSVSC